MGWFYKNDDKFELNILRNQNEFNVRRIKDLSLELETLKNRSIHDQAFMIQMHEKQIESLHEEVWKWKSRALGIEGKE